ncbi:MAG: DNA repair protein RecN [Thermomicrobiales bacterium]
MLRELSIADFAIIERSTIRLQDGLTSLTGETGAGKSILLDALGAVLGQRIGSDLVRTGAKTARIEALFELTEACDTTIRPRCVDLGIEIGDDGHLILTREIQASGRSSARINGRMVTASVLAEIGSHLVDIHGQSDHLSLLQATTQRNMLDEYAGLSILRHQVAVGVQKVREARCRLSELERGSRDHIQRLDLLRYQVTEIEEAAIQPDEERDLLRQRDVLLNVDRLRLAVLDALSALNGDELGATAAASGLDSLRELEASLQQVSEIDASTTGMFERASELVVLADDLNRDLRTYLDTVEADPDTLQLVEDRLSLLRGLIRKYGATVEDVLEYQASAQAEVETLTDGSFDVAVVQQSMRQAEAELVTLVSELSRQREEAAAELGPLVEQNAADLKMGRSQLKVDVRHRPDVSGITMGSGETVAFDESGIDDVEFLFAPNVGETFRPLGRIASGGETARLMLALKSILSEVDQTPTLVFDEIDVGVGARSGQVVGEKLWKLSRTHQVVVVTHLPQIAAYGDDHLRITKREIDGRTVSSVDAVSDALRIDELAYMIDGVPATDESRANASVILERIAAVKAATVG